MKKIALISTSFNISSFSKGGMHIIYRIMSKFISLGYEIDVYCNYSDLGNHTGINIKLIEQTVNVCEYDNIDNFHSGIKELVKNKDYKFVLFSDIITDFGVSIIHSHSFSSRKKGKNPILQFLLYDLLKSKRISYEKSIKKFKTFPKVIVFSNSCKQDLNQNLGIPEGNIKVIYPGIDTSERMPLKKERSCCLTFGLSATSLKNKGGFIFFKALNRLKKQGYKFKAKVIYPHYKKDFFVKLLLKFYRINDCIEFLGLQEDMEDFYNSIDCLVMPSLREGFGLVTLEAMSKGKVVIVSDNSGAADIIEDEINGLLFSLKNNSYKNLSEKMIKAIKNPELAKICSQNAFETAKSHNWEGFLSKFFAAIDYTKIEQEANL